MQVLGGSRNEVRGRFSAALGFNANVLGKYSCSMAFQGGRLVTTAALDLVAKVLPVHYRLSL